MRAFKKRQFLSFLMRLNVFPDIFGVPLNRIFALSLRTRLSPASAGFRCGRQLFWEGLSARSFSVALLCLAQTGLRIPAVEFIFLALVYNDEDVGTVVQ